MPVFPKPKFQFEYDLKAELSLVRAHKAARGIPAKAKATLLAATWNIANLGAQERRDDDKAIIAEILGWFDIVAVQECRENYRDLFDIKASLPKSYKITMSDVAGNDERMAFVYDSDKLSPLEEIGEIAFPPSDYKYVKLPGISKEFEGFDRNPYLVSFSVGKTSIMFVNVHLFYGDEKPESIARRSLETFAVARWAKLRGKNELALTEELVVLGDFNMPKCEEDDPIYKALTKYGLELPEHATQIASSISSDSKYDQIAILPETARDHFTGKKGVFDYDAVLFPDLWKEGKNRSDFLAYLRYYLSDHRPMWMELRV